jgi:hypothetical protein
MPNAATKQQTPSADVVTQTSQQDPCAFETAQAAQAVPQKSMQKTLAAHSVPKALADVPVKNQILVEYAYKVLMREPHQGAPNAWQHANTRMQELFGVGLAAVEKDRAALTKIHLTPQNGHIVEQLLHAKRQGNEPRVETSSTSHEKNVVTGSDIINTLYRHANALYNQYGENAAKMIGAKKNTPDELVERLADLTNLEEKTGRSIWRLAEKKNRQEVFQAGTFDEKQLVQEINRVLGAHADRQRAHSQTPVRQTPQHRGSDGKEVVNVQPSRDGLSSRRTERVEPQTAPTVSGKQIVALYDRTADELQRILGKNAAAFVGATSNSDRDLTAAIAKKLHFREYTGVEMGEMGRYSRSRFDVSKYRVADQERALTKLVDEALELRNSIAASPEARVAWIEPKIRGNWIFNSKSADALSAGSDGQLVKEASARQVSVLGIPVYERVDGEPGVDGKYGVQRRIFGVRVRNQGQETGDMATVDHAVRRGLRISLGKPRLN